MNKYINKQTKKQTNKQTNKQTKWSQSHKYPDVSLFSEINGFSSVFERINSFQNCFS